jgi:hypothetical protein
MLGSHKPGAPWSREPGAAGGYIVTDDPDPLYERALQRKADIAAYRQPITAPANLRCAVRRTTCGPSAITGGVGASVTFGVHRD